MTDANKCNKGDGEYYDGANKVCTAFSSEYVSSLENHWPKGLIGPALWDACQENGCNGKKVYEISAVNRGFECRATGYALVLARITGEYKGWGARNALVTAVLDTNNKQVGIWRPWPQAVPAGWTMPYRFRIRNHDTGEWLNVDIRTPCAEERSWLDGTAADKVTEVAGRLFVDINDSVIRFGRVG